MEYLDFELQLSADPEGAYRVEVLRSPAGEARAAMPWPFAEEELARLLRTVKTARNTAGHTRKATGTHRDLDTSSQKRDTGADIEGLGRALFDSLMASEVRACYRTSLERARKQGKGLRLRLRTEAPKLAALPWEYLYDDAEGDHLCLSTDTPVLRYLELGRAPEPLTVEPPLRILGLVASPSDHAPLDVVREKSLMSEAIDQLADAGYVELTWLAEQTWRDLQAAMRQGPWHAFHFIGHGGFDTDTGEGLMVLADERGAAHRLSATNLGRLLAGHPSMRLAVLNSCEGARASETDLFSSTGSVLTRRGIPAVVSMQYEISDRAALEFSRTFYETLAEGIPVDAAVLEARKAICMALDNSPEWATPVLHMRAADGRLFDIDVAGALFDAPRPGETRGTSPPAPSPEQPPARPPPAGDQDRRGLGILLRKVRQFWVDGVLDQSLHRSTLIKLGLDAMPTMVESPFGSIPMAPDQTVRDVFDEMGGSLLILGEPGAGKTTLLLTLARDLLARAETDPSLPVPVVFNLSSWAGTGGPLDAWMVAELSTKYQIPKKIGQGWIEAGRLLLLLDGLDEVLTEQRVACVEAVNAYIQAAGLASVAVCCRLKEYLGLKPARLALNGAVRLRLLTREQVLGYFAEAGPSLAALHQALQRDSSLLTLAETPFMLSLMARTYQDVPVKALESEGFATIEARRQQLMQAYVQRQFRLAGGGLHG